MPFHVLEATEPDIARLMEIQFLAFADEPADALINGANTPLNRQHAGARLLNQMRIDPSLHTMKVIHTAAATPPIPSPPPPPPTSSTPSPPSPTTATDPTPTPTPKTTTIVGFCMWHIYAHPRPESEWRQEHAMLKCNWLPPRDTEHVRPIILPIFAGRRQLKGDPYALLMYLCVDPVWQRRGVGTMLVRWGMERCDELAIPAYLEASKLGEPLYRRCGFEDFGQLVVGEVVYPTMLRLPLIRQRG